MTANGELQSRVDLWQRTGWKLDIDYRSSNGDNLAVFEFGFSDRHENLLVGLSDSFVMELRIVEQWDESA